MPQRRRRDNIWFRAGLRQGEDCPDARHRGPLSFGARAIEFPPPDAIRRGLRVTWLLPLLFAPFVGSFLATMIHRLPRREKLVWSRSRCPACATPLGPRDLVPLVSWALSRGRCRHCGTAISAFYPLVELAALAVALSAALVLDGWLVWATCGLGWTLLALGWIDQRHFWLPDAMSLPLIPAGLAVAWAAVPERLPAHLLGAVLGFAVLALVDAVYRRLRGRTGLGWGDAKLLAGLGAWVGWQGLASIVFLAALGGLLAVVALRLAGRPIRMGDSIAFGPYLCLGGWLVWLFGPLTLMG